MLHGDNDNEKYLRSDGLLIDGLRSVLVAFGGCVIQINVDICIYISIYILRVF